MEAMRSTWTDSRLDELNGHVGRLDDRVGQLDDRVGQLDERVSELGGRVSELSNRVDDLSRRMDAGFARVDGRIDALQHTLVHALVGMSAAMLTGFVGLAALIVAQG